MRPDDHKKKRSADYKKKHGIKAGDQAKEKSKSGKSVKQPNVHDSKSANAVKQEETTNKSVIIGSHTRVLKGNEELTYNDDLFRRQEQFRRREIASNWEKYDLPPDDESVKTRGGDFQTLLDAASTAVTQFKFEEEKEWDEENVSDYEGWLSIDCNELAASMLSIPLHERLGIDEKYFEKAQIENFIRNAADNKKKFSEQRVINDEQTKNKIALPNTKKMSVMNNQLEELLSEDSSGSDIEGEERCTENTVSRTDITDNTNEQLLDDLLAGDSINSPVSPPQIPVSPDTDIPVSNSELHVSDNQSSIQHSNSEDINAKSDSQSSPVVSVSQTLAEIKPNTSTVEKTKPATDTVNVKPIETVNLEDELDKLLDLDETPSAAPKTTLHANNDGALEDWLDSMLDD